MLKLVVDMNLPPKWVDFLIGKGYTAQHWSDVGSCDAKDQDIVEYAKQNDYVILTNDLDFGAILAISFGTKPSVVQIRANDVRIEAVGETVAAAIKQSEFELVTGALVTVLPERARVRVLPLLNRNSNSTD